MYYISDKALYFVSRGRQVQVTLLAWSYAEIYIHLYVHCQLLSIAITEWVDDSNSQSENKPHRKSLNEPQNTKIKPVCLHIY